MKILIALRHPLRKNQMRTIEKCIQFFPRSKIVILHISKSMEGTEDLIRERFGKKAKVIAIEGPLVETINKVASQEGVDLVVLGKHRRGLVDVILDGLVETDTSAYLLKRIKKPVLVV